MSTSLIATACQFIQTTDPTFPLLYFTVDSSLFAGAVAGCRLLSPNSRELRLTQISAVVSVLVSAVVYTAVIAPASETGSWVQPHDDYWVRAATFLFHLILPALVALDFFHTHVGETRLPKLLFGSLAWPATYLVSILAITELRLAPMPYPFLDRSEVGIAGVCGGVGVMTLLITVIAGALWWANQRFRVPSR